MQVKQITELFLNLEKDQQLFDLKIDNDHVWNYLRADISQDIFDFLLKYNIVTLKKHSLHPLLFFINNLSILVKNYVIPFFNHKPISLKSYDIIFFNPGLCEKVNGEYINQYSYPIVNALFKKYKVAVCDRHGYAKQLSHYPCNIIDIRPMYLRTKVLSLIKKNTLIEREIIDIIYNHIFLTFNYKINKKKYLQLLKFRLLNSNKWKRILNKSGLKAIIYCNDGNMPEIIRVAKINQIKTIEFQHCFISNLNILYNYKSESENIYCNDYLITWGQGWHEMFNARVKSIPIGSITKFFTTNVQDSTKINKKKNILIIGSIKYRVQLSALALELSNQLNNYHIYYKLRPEEYNYWRDVFPSNFAELKNLTIIDNYKHPLEYYLKLCKYIAGVESTVLLEGIFQGQTPLFIKDKHGWYKEYEIFQRSGFGVTVKNAKDIIDFINTKKEPNHSSISLSNLIKKFNEDSFLKFLNESI